MTRRLFSIYPLNRFPSGHGAFVVDLPNSWDYTGITHS